MNVHISYKVPKTPDIEKDINHQIEKIRKRLQVFRPELVHLKGVIEQNSAREGFIVSLNLRLPSGQMAVQKTAGVAAGAIRASFDDLLQQLTKHKDLLRSSHKWRRLRRGSDVRPEPQVPFEQTVAAVPVPTISSDDIRSYVNANLGRLERYVEREIYLREASDLLQADAVTKEEVIDEAIARAMGDGVEKPERLALEPWLYRLALRSLDELAARSTEGSESVHLQDSARRRNVRGSDEPQLQYHQPDEMLTAENVIADRRTASPEDIASTDEMLAMVELALRGAQHTDREAFILYALEGFSVEEIAAIIEHKPEEVRSSIASAREHLRKSPPIANQFREKLLQKTDIVL
ncbi:MAG TPA: sigma factor-like helix-turn-helix DNA-binding protein [Terriglobales bacterium]|nr:sigma factor-like helix-turn-helix DNA-binding protein [Terriglobales bacterium]